jgi:hypothetical protein
MAAPIAPLPEDVSGLAQFVDWAKEWSMPLFGGGFLLWLLRAAQWKRDVETTQGQHAKRLDALEAADDARAENHNKLALAVAALPRRDEVREMISELREDVRASLQAGGGRD